MKGIGTLLRGCGQLPVRRGEADAANVLKVAEQALADGECVVIYPEGTASRDPEQWPMIAKTGVARLALASGVPVIPVACWGAQDILPYGTTKPHLWPRHTVKMLAGPPVDLTEFEGKPFTADVLRGATNAIMADVATLLAELRGEQPPAEPYHPAIARRAARQAARAQQDAAQQDAPREDRAQEDRAREDGAPADSAEQDGAPQAAARAQAACRSPARTLSHARRPRRESGGHGGGHVGHHVRPGALRRGHAGHAVGPPPRAGGDGQRPARES